MKNKIFFQKQNCKSKFGEKNDQGRSPLECAIIRAKGR